MKKHMILLLLVALALLLCLPATAHAASWHRVNASMYGGPHDPGQDSLAAGVGKATRYRNIVAMRTGKVGDLYLIRYRRHHTWYMQLVMRGDYGPAAWTGRAVDILWGCAKRLAFPGTGHVSIKKVGHLPRRLWRKFRHYGSLSECRHALHWVIIPLT